MILETPIQGNTVPTGVYQIDARLARKPENNPDSTKTCFRCGSEFPTQAERVCPSCRKPKVRGEKLTLNRTLTFREKQIAELVCQAKLNKEIAFELRLTEGTIKEYLNRVFRKLQLKNRTELAMWFVRNQLAA